MSELRKQAKKLKDEKKFSEAVEIYEKVWSKENQDKWLGWEYAHCLKQINDTTKAISVCKHTYLLDNTFVYNNDLMAWCVYEKFFRNKKETYTIHEVENLEKIGQAIIKLIKQSPKTAYEYIIFSMVAVFKKRGDKASCEKIIEWLQKLDVSVLSDEITSYVDSRGIDSELQSRKEEYYSGLSKSFATLERYQECISCCEEAEAIIDKFHYNNDIWIPARKFYSYGMLGSHDKAIAGIKELLNKKNHWSLLYKIALIYDAINEHDKTLNYSYGALLSRDPIKMKIKVLLFVAKKLHDCGEKELADIHYLYYKKVREENGWGISLQVESYIKSITNLELDISPANIKNIWLRKIKSTSRLYIGKVSRIMPNKKNGFISFDGGSVYFKMNETFGKNRVKENVKVSFIIEDSFDFSKNKKTKEAKYIEVIKQ